MENTEESELLTDEEEKLSAKKAQEAARKMTSPVEETNQELLQELIERAEDDQEE